VLGNVLRARNGSEAPPACQRKLSRRFPEEQEGVVGIAVPTAQPDKAHAIGSHQLSRLTSLVEATKGALTAALPPSLQGLARGNQPMSPVSGGAFVAGPGASLLTCRYKLICLCA